MSSFDKCFEAWFREAKQYGWIVDDDIQDALEDPICAYHMLMECWDESLMGTGKLTQEAIRKILNKKEE